MKIIRNWICTSLPLLNILLMGSEVLLFYTLFTLFFIVILISLILRLFDCIISMFLGYIYFLILTNWMLIFLLGMYLRIMPPIICHLFIIFIFNYALLFYFINTVIFMGWIIVRNCSLFNWDIWESLSLIFLFSLIGIGFILFELW